MCYPGNTHCVTTYSQLPKVGKFKLQDITDPDEELINFERDGIINQKVCASDNYISQ